jgi:hypothetical protein
VLIRMCAALACPAALTLGACTSSLSPPPVGSIGAGEPSPSVATAQTAVTAVGQQVAAATGRLAGLLKALPGACAAPCLSPAEEDAIIARAVAEHEMRRP